ncbi:MAG: prepilin-type N-terminal cleavage/methylation domain-containing protein [Erysipelotrichaceae bacterium]|jgi:prepilin-type N-terminal cleavage/methylation domain-containing protein
MVRQKSNRGYSLIETIFVLFILSIFILIVTPIYRAGINRSSSLIINEIVMVQYEAILESYYEEYDSEEVYIRFNRTGNVNMANTYDIEGNEIVVSLGTGRVYEKNKER